jgi:hypothetical protein
MTLARLSGLSLALATLAGCDAPSALLGPDAPQGIEGQALLGPMCPVVQVDNPCPDQPYAAWIDVLDRNGRPATRLRADQEGRFRVGLEPGAYVLHPESGDPLPRAGDQEVEVPVGKYVTVTVSFDTGIR